MTGPRSNDTDSFRYWAANIQAFFTNIVTSILNIGSGTIQATTYTIQEVTGWLHSVPNLKIQAGSNNNGTLLVVPGGTATNCTVSCYTDSTNAAGIVCEMIADPSGCSVQISDFNTPTGNVDLTLGTNSRSMVLHDVDGSLTLPGIIGSYNGITTVGQGVSTVLATSTQNAVSNTAPTTLSLTPASAAGIYRVSGYVNVTTGTTIALALNVTYKDPQGNARTDGVVFQKAGSATLLTSLVTTGQHTFHETIAIDNSGTAITVANNAGTYTTCVYDIALAIERIA